MSKTGNHVIDMLNKNNDERPFRESIVFKLNGSKWIPVSPCPKCTTCGKDVESFDDRLSVNEYMISGMCQACQDSVFNEEL